MNWNRRARSKAARHASASCRPLLVAIALESSPAPTPPEAHQPRHHHQPTGEQSEEEPVGLPGQRLPVFRQPAALDHQPKLASGGNPIMASLSSPLKRRPRRRSSSVPTS